jgi:signal transduction histidine kinase
MGRTQDIIALVGEGDAGRALLEALLAAPGIEVRYYVDTDAASPGVALARERGVSCRGDGRCDEVRGDPEVDLIVETTGAPGVRASLAAGEHPDPRLLDPAGVRLVLGLLDAGRGSAGPEVARRGAAGLPADERQDYERRIAELTEAVERAPVEQACYVRQASHQVKTPLSAIQSYVNVILGGYTGEIPERTREVVQKIHSRCGAALANLGKCRMLADVRCSGRDGLEMSTVHLDELVGQAVELHAELAGRRGVEVRRPAYDGADLVHCDARTTVVLLSELVENAVVYSHEGGLVEVAVEPAADGRLAVVVRDRGIGIPERCLPRIFAEDYRADPAVQHHPDGAGVGLTIARAIADLQGFDLSVESEEGQGSVFRLTVPAAPPEHMAAAPTGHEAAATA